MYAKCTMVYLLPYICLLNWKASRVSSPVVLSMFRTMGLSDFYECWHLVELIYDKRNWWKQWVWMILKYEQKWPFPYRKTFFYQCKIKLPGWFQSGSSTAELTGSIHAFATYVHLTITLHQESGQGSEFAMWAPTTFDKSKGFETVELKFSATQTNSKYFTQNVPKGPRCIRALETKKCSYPKQSVSRDISNRAKERLCAFYLKSWMKWEYYSKN